jgi:hypothetical protein
VVCVELFLCNTKKNYRLAVSAPVTQVSLPTVTTACPPPSRIFHGRRIILQKMLDYFATDMGKRHICLLYGLGGSGKTQIALKFLGEVDSTR